MWRREAEGKTTETEITEKRPKNKQPKDTKHTERTKPQIERGEGASVEKPDTSLVRQFKHFDTEKEKPINSRPHNDIRQLERAAHTAVSFEKGVIRGDERGGEAGNPDSL